MYRLKETFNNGLLGKTYVFEKEGGGPRYWVTANWTCYVAIPQRYGLTVSNARYVPISAWSVLSEKNFSASLKK